MQVQGVVAAASAQTDVLTPASHSSQSTARNSSQGQQVAAEAQPSREVQAYDLQEFLKERDACGVSLKQF